MKIDFCSDLHVDAWFSTTKIHDPNVRMWMGEPYESTYLHIDWRLYKNPDSRVLVIAGDISNNMVTSVGVVEAAAAEYEYVVVVEGNHDHYESDVMVESGMKLFKHLLTPFANVHYLDSESSLVLDGVGFFGATGWYDWKAYETAGISDYHAKRTWSQYSNDARYPQFECSGPDSLAMTQAVNLAAQVKAANADPAIHSIVMTTHMSPRAELMEWKVNDTIWNALTPSYVNTALKLVLLENSNAKITHWIYGHTHARQMVEMEGIVYANNARGYPRENPPFMLNQIEVKEAI